MSLDPLVEERILTSLHHREGDRVPIWDYLDSRAIFDHFNPEGTDYHEGMVRVYHELGIDLCRGYGSSYSQGQEGETSETSKISGGTRWATQYPIQSLEDLRNYEAQLPTQEALGEWVEHVRARQRAFEPYTMYVPGGGCGFHATYGLMGVALFATAIYDARDDLERVMWGMAEASARYARAAARERLCPLYFIGDDIAYKEATLFSPKFLRETFIECLRRSTEPLKNERVKVIFHSDGNVMSVLDDMLDVGIDGLNPIEPIAGMDIGYLKRRYGTSLVLVGNVDCSQVLPLGTSQEVVEATKECIRQASPGGGHFIGSSSEIVPSTPVENILAFYEAAKRWGRYPIRI